MLRDPLAADAMALSLAVTFCFSCLTTAAEIMLIQLNTGKTSETHWDYLNSVRQNENLGDMQINPHPKTSLNTLEFVWTWVKFGKTSKADFWVTIVLRTVHSALKFIFNQFENRS